LAEQRQALRDDLGRKEGAHILNIMRWADSIRVNRNDIATGMPRNFWSFETASPSGEYLQHADEEL
jgi:hypothetical protein